MARYGRDWLRRGYAARLAIVVGSKNVNGLKMFDTRVIWQITYLVSIRSRTMIVELIIGVDYTPTVGLGCRSGSYVVYIIIAVGLLLIEIFAWWLTHERAIVPTIHEGQASAMFEENAGSPPEQGVRRLRQAWTSLRDFRSKLDIREVIKTCVMRPGEIFNSGWLAYTIAAQKFGSYQTYECLASTWAGSGVGASPFFFRYAEETNTCLGVYRL